ncbi:cupin domain-containing protein [Novosphingobium mangrovi (ex Huang et al. 2023)]|uniref:ChrR-like cupin domain-containing protein n=1 Tax=Novosphingobium mangrovi (ex Huang et al. 2023) TaxID=2976432 RepID=A0ABT2I8Q6_9SPHN|nr:hypothetical protein [Novosphingobium mangrovi (ex Huang et al. 2023)]MCT2401193.1 hypothetical protein [Novosphingobium mangrovi (ex Huang et al. 2023)]
MQQAAECNGRRDVAIGKEFGMASETSIRNVTTERLSDGSMIVRPDSIPWTPWALDGTYFKLLAINRRSGMWTVMMKIDPNTQTDNHYHFGDVHVYVTSGGHSYVHDRVNAEEINIECGSVAHEPTIGPDGQESFNIFYGGISGTDAEGNPVGDYVDVEWMYKAAKANNAAGHLESPPPVREMFFEG